MQTIDPPPIDIVPTAAERAARGKALRDKVPRSSHSAWIAPPDRRDPLQTLADASRGRVNKLLPLRNARMAESAFAFFRGSASIMAADLARTPVSGAPVQLCGDAHCLNFGAFATPERRLIFDVNDFDETLPGPWEWDLKRLAASLVLAARSIKLAAGDANIAVLAAVRAYRLRMLELATKRALDVWYTRIDVPEATPGDDADDRRRRRRHIIDGARTHSMAAAVEKITVEGVGGRRFIEEPPLLYHPAGVDDAGFDVGAVLHTYAQSLAHEVRVLFERYRLVDHAVKVVGVGSIGTRCSVALVQADADDLLILQIKEAVPSVLEGYAGGSGLTNHGQRVVFGQRLMQSASDALLGWGSSGDHDFYVRQYRDKKITVNIAALDGFGLRDYAEMCGSALAKSHARSGDAALIGGYLGKRDTFDKAIVRFGLLYADQAEADFAVFRAAVDAGTIAIR